MEDLIEKQSKPTRLLKIDLSDRSRAGPVAQQHGIRSIPRLFVYDGTEQVASETGAALQYLTR